MKAGTIRKSGERSGVALIMALCALSLMIIAVSAFSISMRLERVATRNASDAEKARQYLRVADALAQENLAYLCYGETYTSGDWEGDAVNGSISPSEPVMGQSLSDVLRMRSEKLTDAIDPLRATKGIFYSEVGFKVPKSKSLFYGAVTNLVPPGLHEAARSVEAGWFYVTATNKYDEAEAKPAGRFSYMLVDLSGFLDLNYITTNQYYAAVPSVGSGDLPDIFHWRDVNGKYVLPSELLFSGMYQPNGTWPAVEDDLFNEFLNTSTTFSLSPTNEQFILKGTAGDIWGVVTTNRFNLCAFTNDTLFPAQETPSYNRYHHEQLNDDQRDFMHAVTNMMVDIMGYDQAAANRILWNIVNYMDSDSIPQTDTTHPWLDDYGFEATPMLNEFAVTNCITESASNAYHVAIETWNPYATSKRLDANPRRYKLDASVFYASLPDTDEAYRRLNEICAGVTAIEDGHDGIWHSRKFESDTFGQADSSAASIGLRTFGTADIDESAPIKFFCETLITNIANAAFCTISNAMPIGLVEYTSRVVISNEGNTLASADAINISALDIIERIETNVLNVIISGARITDCTDEACGMLVDEAPGPHEPGDEFFADIPESYENESIRFHLPFIDNSSYEVLDPRYNGRFSRWSRLKRNDGDASESGEYGSYADENHSGGTNTIGSLNALFTQYVDDGSDAEFQGLPLIHRDAPFLGIGEIGLVASTNAWQSINLFTRKGAALLDCFCIQPEGTNNLERARHGRIHALTPFPAAIRAMFAEVKLGTNILVEAESREDSADCSAFSISDMPDLSLPELLPLTSGSVEAQEILATLTNTLISAHQPCNGTSDAFTSSNRDVSERAYDHASFETFLPQVFIKLIGGKDGDAGDESATGDADNPGNEAETDSSAGAKWRKLKLFEQVTSKKGAGIESDETGISALPQLAVARNESLPAGIDALEDVFRTLPDTVTFRQNIFLVIKEAHSLTPAGRFTAKAREATFYYRDAFTGRFIPLRTVSY